MFHILRITIKLLGVSVVEDCKYLIAIHRYRKGHGFKSRTGLNFFQALFSLLLKSVHYWEDRFHIQVSVMLEFSTFFSYLYKLSWNQKTSFAYEWNGYRKNGIEAKLHIISSVANFAWTLCFTFWREIFCLCCPVALQWVLRTMRWMI